MKPQNVATLILGCFLFLGCALIYGMVLPQYNPPASYFLDFLALCCSVASATMGSIGFYLIQQL